MAQRTREELRAIFQTGYTPTQNNYDDVWDSFVSHTSDEDEIRRIIQELGAGSGAEAATLNDVFRGTDEVNRVNSSVLYQTLLRRANWRPGDDMTTIIGLDNTAIPAENSNQMYLRLLLPSPRTFVPTGEDTFPTNLPISNDLSVLTGIWKITNDYYGAANNSNISTEATTSDRDYLGRQSYIISMINNISRLGEFNIVDGHFSVRKVEDTIIRNQGSRRRKQQP